MAVTSNHMSQAKRVIHRRDSFIMVAEQALRSERLQVGIRARVGNRAGWWSWRYGLNASKLESELVG